MKKTVYLVLKDGLGNQMFEYAAARAYQLEFNCDLKLCVFSYGSNFDECGRQYALNALVLCEDVTLATAAENAYVEKCVKESRGKLMINRIIRKIPICGPSLLLKQKNKKGVWTCTEAFQFRAFVKELDDKTILQSSFQTPEYFERYRSQIKTELRVRHKISDKNKVLVDDIHRSESVCVHIRRGDYLDPRFKHLNICGELYYVNAMNYILAICPNPVFYIFSNTTKDIDWIRQNYKLPGKIIYVNNKNKDYEDLQVMYQCKHFVLSNSTFSWWAQYLSSCDEKIVCAPFHWNLRCKDTEKNIYEKNWVLINEK